MYKMLEVCNADINKALFKNVMFFSLAEPGAMGQPGAVIFYVKSGELYHFNYVCGDVDMSKVEKKFPVLAETHFGVFGINTTVPEGWHYVYLGMGNHLLIKDEVYEAFRDVFAQDTPPEIYYQNWIDAAGVILGVKQ